MAGAGPPMPSVAPASNRRYILRLRRPVPPVTTTADPAARTLTRGDAKTLTLAALGGALEYYDFIIFVFFTAVIGKLFFPPDTPDWLRQLQTFGVFAACMERAKQVRSLRT